LRKRKSDALALRAAEVLFVEFERIILVYSNDALFIPSITSFQNLQVKRRQKLQPLDEAALTAQKPCCKRQCLDGERIPRTVLVGVREQFIKHSSREDRKRAIVKLRTATSATSFALAYATYPICWKSLCYITGVSTTLLQSVVGSPSAR
jgi:hypothetical protein